MGHETPRADQTAHGEPGFTERWEASAEINDALRILRERWPGWVFGYLPGGTPMSPVPAFTARFPSIAYGERTYAARTVEDLEELIRRAEDDPPPPFVTAF